MPTYLSPQGGARIDIGGREIKEIRKLFGEFPVIDASSDMLVYVNLEDQELGVPGDPSNCMFSRACKRAFGSQGVLFYPTVAYVDMLDPSDNSQRVVMRFLLPKKTRQRLERFEWDRNHTIEATFLLKAVPKTKRTVERRKFERKRQTDLKSGKRQIDPKRSAAAKRAHKDKAYDRLLGIRSGSGQIHTRS
jgi:hypothetical protein